MKIFKHVIRYDDHLTKASTDIEQCIADGYAIVSSTPIVEDGMPYLITVLKKIT